MHVGADFLKWPPSSLNKREVAKQGNALHISSLLAFASQERLPCYACSQHQLRLHPTPQWTKSFSLSLSLSHAEEEPGRLLHLSLVDRPREARQEGGRDEITLFTPRRANRPTERTNFQSPQLFWSSGNSPSIRRPPGARRRRRRRRCSHARTAHFITAVRVSPSFQPNPQSSPKHFSLPSLFSLFLSLSLTPASPWSSGCRGSPRRARPTRRSGGN